MGNYMFDKLQMHFGHDVDIVAYGEIDNPVCYCLECEDCGEVVVNSEDYDCVEDSNTEIINAIDIVCSKCFAMYDEDGNDVNEVDGFCDACPVRYYVAASIYNTE